MFRRSPNGLGLRWHTYISDGYVNFPHRQADKDGVWLKSGANPATSRPFNIPHSIASTHRTCLTSRSRHRRIQVFDNRRKIPPPDHHRRHRSADARAAIGAKPTANTGTMAPGAPWTLCITPGSNSSPLHFRRFRPHLQALPRRKVLGMLGKAGKQPGNSAGSTPSPALGKRTVCRGNFELARTETRPRTRSLRTS